MAAKLIVIKKECDILECYTLCDSDCSLHVECKDGTLHAKAISDNMLDYFITRIVYVNYYINPNHLEQRNFDHECFTYIRPSEIYNYKGETIHGVYNNLDEYYKVNDDIKQVRTVKSLLPIKVVKYLLLATGLKGSINDYKPIINNIINENPEIIILLVVSFSVFNMIDICYKIKHSITKKIYNKRETPGIVGWCLMLMGYAKKYYAHTFYFQILTIMYYYDIITPTIEDLCLPFTWIPKYDQINMLAILGEKNIAINEDFAVVVSQYLQNSEKNVNNMLAVVKYKKQELIDHFKNVFYFLRNNK